MTGMDATEARTANIRALVDKIGGPAAFIANYGSGQKWTPEQVSQWTSASKPKGIGRNLARAIEKAAGLPHGSFDIAPELAERHSQSALLDLDRLGVALTAMDRALADVELQGKLGTLRHVLQFAYAEAFELQNPNDKAQRNLLDKLVAERLRDWSGREEEAGSVTAGATTGRAAAPTRKKAGRGG